MTFLVIRSWLLLARLDVVLQFGGFGALHKIVRGETARSNRECIGPTDESLCHAVDLACVFYFKRVMCLQRSAATTILLRRFGRNAELVIGAQLLPLRSHAWVENHGRVLNDKPYMPDLYQVLDRC